MSNNWSTIGSGATFHALVNALLLYEDRQCRVFNREGPDGGVDAISGDRKTIFQAKHHRNGDGGRAISDALAELKKIQMYRQPGHKWQAIWRDVERWTLLSDVSFGTADDERWEREVVPAFRGVGLKAQYEAQPQLDLRLHAHPDVADAFFGRRTRMFVSVAEHREKLLAREVLPRAYDVSLRGRQEAFDRVGEFVLGDRQVMLVHGAGGLGKSRFLLEAASRLLDAESVETVYCGTTHLEVGPDWYVGIVPEAKALVLLDEPQTSAFIKRLLEELSSRTKNWKVLVSSRTANDPIIRPLVDPRERQVAPPLELKPLASADASSLAEALLEPLRMEGAALERAKHLLVDVCGRFPIWMTVAIHLLEEHADLRDLPADTKGIAKAYVDEIVTHTAPMVATATQTLDLLRWIALTQPLNRQDLDGFAYVATAAGFQDAAAADRAIEDLARRRAVTCYGIERRMVEVRPDVLRDHLLVDWLTYLRDDGIRRASSEAQRLADDLAKSAVTGEGTEIHRRVVRSLGRMEFLVEPRVAFLDSIAEAVVKAASEARDTLRQERVLEFAKAFAYFRPQHLADIARIIRAGGAQEVVDGSGYYARPVLRDNLVDSLPPVLFTAAHGANEAQQKRVLLEEMIACADDQAARGVGAMTGDAAAEILPRMVQERHGFRSDFTSEAASVVNAALDGLGLRKEPRDSVLLLVRSLLQIERHESFVTPDSMLQSERRRLRPDGPSGKVVAAIHERLWRLTSGDGVGARIAWKLLDYLQGQVRQLPEDAGWRSLVLNDLQKCLEGVSSGMTLENIQAARPLWAWHVQHGRDPEMKEIALKCQDAYLRSPVIRDYDAIFGAVYKVNEDPFRDVVLLLPNPLSERDLQSFFEGAIRFTGTHSDDWRQRRVLDFAQRLGTLRGGEAGVRSFVENRFRVGSGDAQFAIAIAIAGAQIHSLRAAEDRAGAASERDALGALLTEDLGWAQFLDVLYPLETRGGQGFELDDFRFLISRESTFASQPSWWRFEILGRFLPVTPAVLQRAEAEIVRLPIDERPDAVARLWSGYFHSLPFEFAAKNVSTRIANALLDLTVLLGDPRSIHGQAEWQMQQILGHVPLRPISWLVEISRRRRQAFADENERRVIERVPGRIRALPTDHSILLNSVQTVPDGPLSEEVERSLDDLSALASESYMDAYALPEVLVNLDPHGRYVPRRVARRIQGITTARELAGEVGYAGWYPFGSAQWRELATLTCLAVESLGASERERVAVYAALTPHDVESWGGHPNELHPRWQQAIDDALAALAAEAEPCLRGFWEWRVRCAEVQMRQEQGEFEERHLRD